jgi:hypothetical protein
MAYAKVCPECGDDFFSNRCHCGYKVPTPSGPNSGGYSGSHHCKASDCPLAGSMPGGMCRHHWPHDGRSWGQITAFMRRHESLLRLITPALSGLMRNSDGNLYSDAEALAGIARFTSSNYPILNPVEKESIKVWGYRADAWLAKQISELISPPRDRSPIRKAFRSTPDEEPLPY